MERLIGKILFLVDPDSAVRDSVRGLLSSYGVSVRTYASGRSLLNNAQIQEHHCVVVENILPDMTGIDLLLYLKQKGSIAPFVLLSSANDAGFEDLATSQDIAAVMRKPIRSEHLIEIIKVL
jgi:two-component system response regulator FixJ